VVSRVFASPHPVAPRRPPYRRLALPALALWVALPVGAEEATPLGTVSVEGQPPAEEGELVAPGGGSGTQFEVTPEGMALFAAPGGGSAYSAVSGLPSVEAQTVDAYGYANIAGGNKGLRVRGENATHGANGTVDGLPLTGMGPGPGYLWLFDQENIAGVTLHQGPVPPDAIDLFNTYGTLDSRLRWPSADAERRVVMSAGSEQFWRGYARLDSGEFAGGTRLFFSGSSASADKWRGPGEAPDHADNLTLAAERPFGDLTARLYFTRSDMAQHNYRPLNYEQASDLSTYRDYDYSADPAARENYYDHNRQAFENSAIIAEFEYQVSPQTSVVVKPYYSQEEGYYLSAVATGKVRKWLIDHDSSGVVTELRTRLAETDLVAGYWHYTMEPPGPPTAWKMYSADSAGHLTFSNWTMLAKVTEDHTFDSLYFTARHDFDALSLEGGVRYVQETLASIDFYNTSGVGDLSYDAALAQSSGVVADRSADGQEEELWLPYLAANYRLRPGLELKFSAGRTMGAAAFNAWNSFQGQYALFAAAGVSAQDVLDKIKPEIADGVDLGLRMEFAHGYLEPTLYYAKFRDKGVSFYDPVVGTAYSQNVGEGHHVGAQLAAGWSWDRRVDLFGALSYNRAVFDKDVVTAGGALLKVEGEQLPDVPEWMANLGLKWQPTENYSVAPVVRFVGSRYADSAHREEVPSYTTVDLTLGYQRQLSFGALELKLAAINLLDREYIGQINASEVQSTGAYNYYPGAPRTLLGTVSVSF